MGSVTPVVYGGLPRPVGSVFRQRALFGSKRWVVSVVDAPNGTFIELVGPHSDQAWICQDPSSFSFRGYNIPEYEGLGEAKRLLSENGWTEFTVRACDVGCGEPLPMYMHDRRGPQECHRCRLRSVDACVECGGPDLGRWIGREAFLKRGVCMSCSHWLERLGHVNEPESVITEDWHAYAIGSGKSVTKGFGGRLFTVLFFDGREVATNDLWTSGVIPERFRDRFVPNATVVNGHG